MSEVSVRLREWQTRGPDDAFSGLRGLSFGDREAKTLARDLTKKGLVEVEELYDGVRITSLAHVGRVRLGRLTVTIEPKLGGGRLLELFRYAYGLRDLHLFGSADFATTGEFLQDLLCRQLLDEVTELFDRGLNRKYVAKSELLSSPRGRLDMNYVARRSGWPEARVLCRHYQRSPEHLLNGVLLAGVELASGITQDADSRRALRRLAKRLGEETRGATLSAATFGAAWRYLDRLSAAYEPALRLVELLYAGSEISLDADATVRVPGFLFDMNDFFQALLDRFLKESLEGAEIVSERSIVGMLRYVDDANPKHRQSPRLRPDFQVRQGSKIVAVLDAKYRDLWERELPREMLYQLALYALSQPRGSTAAILYPTAAADATEAIIEIADPARHGAIGYVALRPVILGKLADALRDGGPGQALLASKLVWGQRRPLRTGDWPVVQ